MRNGTHRSAEHDDVEAAVVVERDGDVECIGDDGQILEPVKILGNLHGRGAGVEDDPVAVVDHVCGKFTDELLFVGMEPLLAADRHVVEIACLMEGDGATFHPDQQFPLFQYGQVFPDGYLRDVEGLHQLFHEDTSLGVEHVQDLASSFFYGIFSFHRAGVRAQNRKLRFRFEIIDNVL